MTTFTITSDHEITVRIAIPESDAVLVDNGIGTRVYATRICMRCDNIDTMGDAYGFTVKQSGERGKRMGPLYALRMADLPDDLQHAIAEQYQHELAKVQPTITEREV